MKIINLHDHTHQTHKKMKQEARELSNLLIPLPFEEKTNVRLRKV